MRLEHSNKIDSKEQPSVTEVATIVAKKLEAIWQKAFIPTVSRTRIVQQAKSYHGKHRNLLKLLKTRQNNVKYMSSSSKTKQGLHYFNFKQRVNLISVPANAKRKHSAVA